MSDNMRIFTEVRRKLKESLKGFLGTQVVGLALMVSGILSSRSSRLNRIAEEAPVRAKVPSLIKRIQRFVKNERVVVSEFYEPFAGELIKAQGRRQIKVVIDGSQVGDGCMVLMLGLVRNNRLLPLCWRVYRGGKGHLGAECHIEVLDMLLELTSPSKRIVLLGDGEFDSIEMLRWLTENTKWKFVVRTAKNSQILRGEKFVPVHELNVKAGEVVWVNDTRFTLSGQLGPFTALAWWREDCSEPIYLLSNFEDPDKICKLYGLRPIIETLFSDQKSRGFGIDKSRISDPERLERLLLAVCLAYLWMLWLGAHVVTNKLEHFIESKSRAEKSFFRLGLDWLKYLLKHQEPIPVSFSVPIIA